MRLVGYFKGKEFNYEVRKRIEAMAPWSKISTWNIFVLPQDQCRNIWALGPVTGAQLQIAPSDSTQYWSLLRNKPLSLTTTAWSGWPSTYGEGRTFFPSPKPSTPALEFTEPPTAWVPALLQGVTLPAWNNHSTPTSAEAKNEWSCTSPTLLYINGVDSHSIISNYMHLFPLAYQRWLINSGWLCKHYMQTAKF